jgi:hypothetical protein
MAKVTGTQNGIHLSMTLLFAGIAGSIIFLLGYFTPSIRHTD